jgi:hypothetical protein
MSRGVARVVSDVSVLCPQRVDDGDNGPATARQRLGEKNSSRVTQNAKSSERGSGVAGLVFP